MFRQVAGRVVRGVSLLLAVGIFAVSFHPIRHAADVKPYASDLLVALALLAPASTGCAARSGPDGSGRSRCIAPVALALSHPAIFVAGGVVVGLAPAVARAGRWRVWIAYARPSLRHGEHVPCPVCCFHSRPGRGHAGDHAGAMEGGVPAAAWTRGPWPDGSSTVHTGGMFAYPCGGERGASSLSSAALHRRGRRALAMRGGRLLLLTCLAPLAWPCGGGDPPLPLWWGDPRLARASHAVPRAEHLPARRGRRRGPAGSDPPSPGDGLPCAGLAALAGIGIAPLVADVIPSLSARSMLSGRGSLRAVFWPEVARDGVPICLRWDLGMPEWDSVESERGRVSLQPEDLFATSPASGRTGPSRRRRRPPLRCVASLCEPDDPRVAAWLQAMRQTHHMKASRTVVVAHAGIREVLAAGAVCRV